tara:strand:+ start:92 stop:385 length:294 start_codon:yes stop_codon:yes gene_type:complete
MPRYHNINGKRVQFTAQEEAQRDAEEKAWADGALNRALARVRKTRNDKLAETDYFGASDQTMSDNMKTYRQELRDITNGLDTVEKCSAVTWPTQPTE